MAESEDVLVGRRIAFEKNADRNIFVIMRYGQDAIYNVLEKTIKETVRLYGFEASLARDVWCHDELWPNIEFCMKHSRYAIVVFERLLAPEFNPNVAVELGYMLGRDKHCLLLKEASLPTLPTDVIGYLYETFKITSTSIKPSVSRAVGRWLEKLGHQRNKVIETIAPDNPVEAKKQRTLMVIEALSSMKKTRRPCILRQAGSLSSLAISENEGMLEAEDPELKKLLLQERDLIESLIGPDKVVRCLISPFVQVVSHQLNILSAEVIRSDVLPRFDQLRLTLERHLDNPQLQIAYTSRLPHDNVLITDEETCRVFIGRRRLRQWGFPHTTIYYNPAIIQSEVERFDSAFFDAAACCIGEEELASGDRDSKRLKLKVIEHLDWCQRQLVNIAAAPAVISNPEKVARYRRKSKSA